MRGEFEAEAVSWPHKRAALTVAVGAKSSGYLLGFPMDSGAYINAGVNVGVVSRSRQRVQRLVD